MYELSMWVRELTHSVNDVFLTVDLQHGRGLCLAYTVLRCAGIRPFILLFHVEQTEAVAVADFKPWEGMRRREIIKHLTGKHSNNNKRPHLSIERKLCQWYKIMSFLSLSVNLVQRFVFPPNQITWNNLLICCALDVFLNNKKKKLNNIASYKHDKEQSAWKSSSIILCFGQVLTKLYWVPVLGFLSLPDMWINNPHMRFLQQSPTSIWNVPWPL